MTTTHAPRLDALFAADETAWLDAMASRAAAGAADDLDLPHLAEYLADMANRDRREVESRLAVLLMHVLKWNHQHDKRSRSWLATVAEQQYELGLLLRSKTLRKYAAAELPAVYVAARQRAATETGLPLTAFPAAGPATIDEVLTVALAGELPE